jgi:hypothetical protein
MTKLAQLMELNVETKERDDFLSFLFDRDECDLVNVKFFRGPKKVDQETFCKEAHRVLRSAIAAPVDTLPVSGREPITRDQLKVVANNR